MEKLFSLKCAYIVTLISMVLGTIIFTVLLHDTYKSIAIVGMITLLNAFMCYVKNKFGMYDDKAAGFCYVAYIISLVLTELMILFWFLFMYNK